MNHFTSMEQSKKLSELGLKSDSADLMYFLLKRENLLYSKCPVYIPVGRNLKETKDIPCWSIGVLLKLIPNYSLRKMGDRLLINFYSAPRITPTPTHVIDDCVDELDAVYQMVCWLLQNNYIKTK